MNQDTSQPIYRLSPELILEIFLHGRPDIFKVDTCYRATWVELVRYLAHITSITGHLRRIALGCGGLWSVVGFRVGESHVDDHYKRALIVMEAFLERAQRCNLHFYFCGGDSAPSWFHSRLLALIMPHIGQARTIQICAINDWKQFCVILNNAVNINNLSLTMAKPIRPNFTPPLNVLRNLKELTLSRIVYDESFHEIMGQVEKLDLTFVDTDLRKWLGSLVQLKWLRIRNFDYAELGSTDANFLARLESLAYLDVSLWIYQSVAPQLSLPYLRHLNLQSSGPDSPLEPQYYHFPLLRTLRIRLELGLLPVVMNPQLEYLEIAFPGSEVMTYLSELLSNPSQGFTPSGATTFPGPSLKYFRLICADPCPYDVPYEGPLWEQLGSILTKAPHLKLDVVAQRFPPGFEGLMKWCPSRVKHYQRVYIPLDELYERGQKDYE